jgi:hypothetical protein
MEAALLRPVLAGRTAITRFHVALSNDALLFPYERDHDDDRYRLIAPARMQRDYPHAWAWLLQHEQRLRRRWPNNWTDANWHGYAGRKNLERFPRPKAMVPYMIDHLAAAWDVEGHYFVNVSTGGYGIEYSDDADPGFVTALLNSQLLDWMVKHYSRVWRGGWFAARSGTLKRLPIVQTDLATRTAVKNAYRSCVRTTAALDTAVSDHDRQIAERRIASATAQFDDLVFTAYRLSPAQRLVAQAT